MRQPLALVLAAFCVAACRAQQPSTAASDTISFRFERPASGIPNYSLTLHGDGSAIYQVAYPAEAPKYSPYAATIQALPDTNVTVNTTISPSTISKLFERVRATNGFAGGCASRAKNIANTGIKTLTYTSSAGAATCVYNYTADKNIAAITSTFRGIALTLDEGRRLEEKHRYDRLALDPETEFLVSEVKQGNAVELSTIAATLRSLADDPQVLERVRARAVALLAQAAVTP